MRGESHITFDRPRQATSSVYVKCFPPSQGYRKVIASGNKNKKPHREPSCCSSTSGRCSTRYPMGHRLQEGVRHGTPWGPLLQARVPWRTWKVPTIHEGSVLYWASTASVRVGDLTTETFSVNRGVCQGCPMFPTLFDVLIKDRQLREIIAEQSCA